METGLLSILLLFVGFFLLVFPDLVWFVWRLGFWGGQKTFENAVEEETPLGKSMRRVLRGVGAAMLALGMYWFWFS